MTENPLHVVIMAGGSGTRFWPASRASRPKQFLPISGGRAMIAETFLRLEGLAPPERILVVTARDQVPLVRTALPELPPENVIAEPEGRNTAPCVALVSRELARRDERSIQIVLPADHVIEPASAFRRTMRAAVEVASEEDVLITFGIVPDHPATGYGYIELGEEIEKRDSIPLHRVARFVEKPERERAREFIESGRFLWNSGMFVWSTASILAALRRHQPEIPAGLDRLDELDGGADLDEVYRSLPALPVDTAIMERANNVRVMPIDYRWNDVGSWGALPEIHPPDARGNWPLLSGGALLVTDDAEGCLAFGEAEEVIALIGVKDLVVVRSGNATLVCPRDRAQEVKGIVERLRDEGPGFL
jgi:mannose-1-phosphate guanylyltransferase